MAAAPSSSRLCALLFAWVLLGTAGCKWSEAAPPDVPLAEPAAQAPEPTAQAPEPTQPTPVTVPPASDPVSTPNADPGGGTTATPRKANYGHYFALRYSDRPTDIAMLCEQPGVAGVVWRQTWREVEPQPGVYDFRSYDRVLQAIADSHNPQCQLWLFVEFKSFANSPMQNPCPAHLQAAHSAVNAHGASTCFMWEPEVVEAYVAMMRAAAKRYDANPRVEGFVLQESALGFNGAYSQDVGDGGTYTAAAWRDALVDLVQACGTAFRQSRCMSFLNFLRGGQHYLRDVASAIAAVSDNRACISGPDLLPDSQSLYANDDSVYQVIVRHTGCRANSAQNDSYGVRGCGTDCIFRFGVGGTFGSFDTEAPRSAGVCVNSYLLWNHLVKASPTGLDWTDALPVIAAYPYGPAWQQHCVGAGGTP
jgi:hypothetical protein